MLVKATEKAGKSAPLLEGGYSPMKREYAAAIVSGLMKLEQAAELFSDFPDNSEYAGRAFDEANLIKFAYSYEQGTLHRPPSFYTV